MVTSHPLSSTPRRDPIARYTWIALLIVAVWINVATYQAPAQAQTIDPGYTILDATPTPALPTPLVLVPGIAPPQLPTPAIMPTSNGVATESRDQPPAIEPAPESPPLAAQDSSGDAPADNSAYIANVGAQEAHSPRGDVAPTAPPADFIGGPILYPDQNIIVVPEESILPTAAAIMRADLAVAVPPISADQAAIIGARQSNGCPSGQTFYPRTGCHLPGSGGAMPGAVGEATP